MRMVHFPTFTRWWAEAQDQVLKFPNGPKDDFVDTLSLLGQGLAKMHSRNRQRPQKEDVKEGTFAALWKQTKRTERLEQQKKRLSGWL
jgi:hypothetical protein